MKILDVDTYEVPSGGRIDARSYRALIARATERHCRDCGSKVDRTEPPDGFVGAPDGEANAPEDQMWPRWYTHSPECSLRILADELGLP